MQIVQPFNSALSKIDVVGGREFAGADWLRNHHLTFREIFVQIVQIFPSHLWQAKIPDRWLFLTTYWDQLQAI